MVPFVGTKDERTGSVIKQVKGNVLSREQCYLTIWSWDWSLYNANKKLQHKFYVMLTFHEPFEFLACKRENNNLYNFKQAHKISASKPRVIIVTNVDTNIKHKKNLTKKLFPDTLQEMMTMTMAR